MKKILLTVLLGFFMQPAFAQDSPANGRAEIYSEEGTLASLYQRNLVTEESYTRLLQANLDPESTWVEVSYSRNVDALVRQVKDLSSTSSKISDVTTPVIGDRQQISWQGEESGRLYNYMHIYSYLREHNWMGIHFSRTLVETIGSSEASEK